MHNLKDEWLGRILIFHNDLCIRRAYIYILYLSLEVQKQEPFELRAEKNSTNVVQGEALAMTKSLSCTSPFCRNCSDAFSSNNFHLLFRRTHSRPTTANQPICEVLPYHRLLEPTHIPQIDPNVLRDGSLGSAWIILGQDSHATPFFMHSIEYFNFATTDCKFLQGVKDTKGLEFEGH